MIRYTINDSELQAAAAAIKSSEMLLTINSEHRRARSMFWRFLLIATVGLLLWTIGCVYLGLSGIRLMYVLAAVPLAFALLLSFFVWRQLSGRAKMYEPGNLIALNWTERGFAVSTDTSNTSTEWNAVERVIDLPEIWLLAESYTAFIIPKRAFPDADERAAFGEMLTAKIPSNK